MRIVIVDDDTFFAEMVAGQVKEFFDTRREPVDIRYGCADMLLDELRRQRMFDVYLLDIEMPDINGLELAHMVKTLDANARIVFLTRYDKYAIQCVRQRAYYYVIKNVYCEELPNLLERICREEGESKEEYYFITTKTYGCKIAVNSILYLVKEKKYTIFHCKDGAVYKERDSLSNIYQRLPEDRFMFVNRGIIVHMKYIVQYRKLDIILQNEEKIPVSKYLREKVQSNLADYWGNMR